MPSKWGSEHDLVASVETIPGLPTVPPWSSSTGAHFCRIAGLLVCTGRRQRTLRDTAKLEPRRLWSWQHVGEGVIIPWQYMGSCELFKWKELVADGKGYVGNEFLLLDSCVELHVPSPGSQRRKTHAEVLLLTTKRVR